jgi:phosphoglycerate dehydrogenase-like enzyme
MSVELLITAPLSESLITPLRGVSPNLRVTLLPARKADEVPAEVWARTEVLYTNAAVPSPEQAPNLKWIQFSYAGIDRWADLPLLARPGLQVTTLSGAGVSQIGEYILMMILALGHKLPELNVHQQKANWPKDRWTRFAPSELRSATVGIVGYGSIGRQVARLLEPFGATVLAAKRNAMQPADTGYTPEGLGDPGGDFVHRLYPIQALKSMLALCDFVVIALPVTSETRGLINAEVFAAIKPTAFLVDISRGGVVDQAALIAALKDGKLAGAALDVFPEEPLPSNNPLWHMSNVIVTPHIADSSLHFDERAVVLFTENLHRYLGGLPLYNLFDPQRGY